MVNYKQFYTNNKPVSGKTKCCEEEVHNAINCDAVIPKRAGEFLKTNNYLSEYSYSDADRERVLNNLGINATLNELYTTLINKIDSSLLTKIGYVYEDKDEGNFLGFENEEKCNLYYDGGKLDESLVIVRWNNGMERGLPIYTKSYADKFPEMNPEDYIVIPDETDLTTSAPEVTDKTYDTSINGPLANILFSAIRQLQSEIAKIKNTFNYGLYSYTGTNTAMSKIEIENNSIEDEPLWAVDEEELSLIKEVILGLFHKFIPSRNVIVLGENTLYCNENGAIWTDEGEIETITDPKIFIYLTVSNPNIRISLLGETGELLINLSLLNIPIVESYDILFVISRTLKISEEVYKGNNFIWISINNRLTDQTILEGYYNLGEIQQTIFNLSDRYTLRSIEFRDVLIDKLKIYSKALDFSKQVIPSKPSEDNYKYKVAHITIRSVKNYNILESILNLLPENELIFVEDSKKLYIKNQYKLTPISGSNDNTPTEQGMDRSDVIDLLKDLGIDVVSYEGSDTIDLSGITFIHQETGIKFNLTIDSDGNLRTELIKDETLSDKIKKAFGPSAISVGDSKGIRGFVGRLGLATHNNIDIRSNGKHYGESSFNENADIKLYSDRIKIGSFYAPVKDSKVFGCSHCYIELENTSDYDFPLDNCYLHLVRTINDTKVVSTLALKGFIPAGGTFLVRGAKKAEFDDPNVFIKVTTFDLEWYDNETDGKLIDLSHNGVVIEPNEGQLVGNDPHGLALLYGKSTITYDFPLYEDNSNTDILDKAPFVYDSCYIDSLYYNSYFEGHTWINPTADKESTYFFAYINPTTKTFLDYICRNTFELDPAKQAYQALNMYDSSRIRHGNPADYLYLLLNKKYIEFPKTSDTYPVSKFTPKASFEGKNVCTDKTQLDTEKPNMVTCSFGKNPYTTRCFNWISGGLFDEYVWIKDLSDNTVWHKFESYKEGDESKNQETGDLKRKEFNNTDIINCIYKRMTGRFPAANTQYTSHKCIINIIENPINSSTALNNPGSPITYTYIVGRADKNGNPDFEYCSEEYTFTLYPEDYVPKIYQITDQQGFHWIEYQVWAAAAKVINEKINNDITEKYTFEEASLYNATLQGALNSIDPLTNELATLYNEAITNGTKVAGNVLSEQEANNYNFTISGAKTINDYHKIIPILVNTGDMTQSGSRINEWLDYYNAGKCLFNHLELMNVVGNNDLCGNDFNILGTGDDEGKANGYYFHLFYCYEVETEEGMIPIINNKYVPSLYNIDFNEYKLLAVNSEITKSNCIGWYNEYFMDTVGVDQVKCAINIYTGWEVRETLTPPIYHGDFTSIYTMIYNMTNNLGNKLLIAMCHEMPFTVITEENIAKGTANLKKEWRSKSKSSLVGSHLNLLTVKDTIGTHWFSRLLEYRGCRLCIGGHKHTYACTYELRENYLYDPIYYTEEEVNEHNSNPENENNLISTSTIKSSSSSKDDGPMTMSSTLEHDDTVIWDDGSENLSKFPLTKRDNIETEDTNVFYPSKFVPNLEGGIRYFMCLATGFKLMSNKELPSPKQTFSEFIPKSTIERDSKDQTKIIKSKANGSLRSPMYAIIELNNQYKFNITLLKLNNILVATNKVFNLIDYSKQDIIILSLIPSPGESWAYGKWVNGLHYLIDNI